MKEKKKNCDCLDDKECSCGENCDCEKEHEKCECNENCKCEQKKEQCECEHKENEYLEMAQRLQADFDNYRKRVAEQLDFQKNEGIKSVIEVFLPCLDTFKEAKKSITDEKVLAGVVMIEEKILNALKSLKVEKIQSIGQKFDHNYHEAIAFLKDETKDNDVILDEFQAGYIFNGKVIRFAKVIINKRED